MDKILFFFFFCIVLIVYMYLNLQQDKIVIQDFVCRNPNIVNTGGEQELCEYEMVCNQQQRSNINITFIPQESQPAKRFKVNVNNEGGREVKWLDEDCREKMCLYLSELEKECNKKDADEQFRNALCIVIGEYFHKKLFGELFSLGITKDELRQYELLIDIKRKEKENNNKFGQRLNSADNDEHQKQGSFDNRKPASKKAGSDGCLCGIWKKFCGCCIKENRNLNTKIDKSNIGNEQINISEA